MRTVFCQPRLFGSSISRISKVLAIALGLAAIVAVGAADARAQVVITRPDGSIGISNGRGGYDYVYRDRLNPLANMPLPGSINVTPFGEEWTGFDGKKHGNVVNPATGERTFYAPYRGN